MGFSDRLCRTQLGRGDDFAPHESKSVPQRLKPSSAQTITARLNPCPSFDSLFPSLSGAVQIGQPKNLIWTGAVEPSPGRQSWVGFASTTSPAGTAGIRPQRNPGQSSAVPIRQAQGRLCGTQSYF